MTCLAQIDLEAGGLGSGSETRLTNTCASCERFATCLRRPVPHTLFSDGRRAINKVQHGASTVSRQGPCTAAITHWFSKESTRTEVVRDHLVSIVQRAHSM